MSAQLEDKATAIGVRRVAGNIGALITGVDIAQPLTRRPWRRSGRLCSRTR